MKPLKLFALILSVLTLSTTAHAKDNIESLTVTTVAHRTDVQNYTVTTPGSSGQQNTTCSGSSVDLGGGISDGQVNCTTTTTGAYAGSTSEKAIYTLTEVVTANGQTYVLQRVARWVWQSAEEIPDGEQVSAEIKGHDMILEGQFRGNQMKGQKFKFRILDIRPSTSVASTMPVSTPLSTVPTEKRWIGSLAGSEDLSLVGGKSGSFRCTYKYYGSDGGTNVFYRDLDEPCPAALSASSVEQGK